jgi:hypothetical protein
MNAEWRDHARPSFRLHISSLKLNKQVKMVSSGLLRRVFWAIALMMEAASTSETSINFYQTTGSTTQKTYSPP